MATQSERVPFNDATSKVEITPEEKAIGTDTYYLFTQRLIRRPAWLIRNNVIDFIGPDPKEAGQLYLKDKEAVDRLEKRERKIRLSDLNKEQIPDYLAYLLADFKMIEDKLPDFMGTANGIYRNIHGIQRSYNQWGAEEGQHSDAIRMILLGTGHKDAITMDNEYYEELAKTWTLPFPTGRMMTKYAMFQEPRTKGYYDQLREVALAHEAWNTGAILQLLSKDEAYHGGAFRGFGKVYAKYDPEGTADDAYNVLVNFLMPAQNLLRNRRKSLLAFARLDQLVDKEKEAIDYLVPALLAAKIMPEERAWAAGAEYAEVADLGKTKIFLSQNMNEPGTKLLDSSGNKLL
jgi:hypothetical protein